MGYESKLEKICDKEPENFVNSRALIEKLILYYSAGRTVMVTAL